MKTIQIRFKKPINLVVDRDEFENLEEFLIYVYLSYVRERDKKILEDPESLRLWKQRIEERKKIPLEERLKKRKKWLEENKEWLEKLKN